MAPERAVAGLAWRELRRGGLIIVAATGGLVAMFGAAYSAALQSPAGSSLNLSSLTDNPAVRALFGEAFHVSTRGGFVVWRGSTIVLLLVALWGTLTATRILRGEEDSGRADLVLAGPVRPAAATGSGIAVMAAVCVSAGAAVALALIAGGSPAGGSALYGAGVGLLGLTFTGVGACAAQLAGTRRTASGIGAAAIGAGAVVRMAADASPGNEWLRWLTPFGWVEELRPFAGDRLVALVPLLLAPSLLFALTIALVGRRDVGAGILPGSAEARARTRLLRGPLRFAGRQRLGGLAGWSAGLTFYGLIIGAITASGASFIAKNPGVQQFTDELGMKGLSTPAGFIASLAGFVAVALALYAVSSVGHCYEDEHAGRLDLPYAQRVTRSRWLGGQVTATAAAAMLTALASILATWVGALLADAGVSLGDVAVATLNVLPAVALFLGLAILLLGIHPSLTVPVGAGAAVAAYTLTFVSPALGLPEWVLDISPFHHLSDAPVSPVSWDAVIVLSAAALLLTALGFLAYERRDLV